MYNICMLILRMMCIIRSSFWTLHISTVGCQTCREHFATRTAPTLMFNGLGTCGLRELHVMEKYNHQIPENIYGNRERIVNCSYIPILFFTKHDAVHAADLSLRHDCARRVVWPSRIGINPFVFLTLHGGMELTK